jgi:hypothetical protein
MGEWCSHTPTKLCGAQHSLCGAICTPTSTSTKCGHHWRIRCEKHAKYRSHPNQCKLNGWRKCKHHLWAWTPSLSTVRTIHRRSDAIQLWARVQQPRLSISTTSGRLEKGGALVIFPFPFFFNFQLVCAYVCVVFSVFIFKFQHVC